MDEYFGTTHAKVMGAMHSAVPTCARSAVISLFPWLIVGLMSACSAGDSLSNLHRNDAGSAPSAFSDAGGAGGGTQGPPGESDSGLDPGSGGDAGAASDEESGFSCFDNVDNDFDGRLDCDDPGCLSTIPSCCVGSDDPVCCVADAPSQFADFTSCLDTPIAGCEPLGESATFGTRLPYAVRIDGDSEVSLVMGGDTFDSGLRLTPSVNLATERTLLSADIAASVGECAGCVDYLAIGWVSAIPGSASRVTAEAAVLINGGLGEIAFVVGGTTMERWYLPDAGFREYALRTTPDGTIEVGTREAGVFSALASARLRRTGVFHPVIFGRTPNPEPGSPAPSRLRSFQLQRDRCDIPSGTSRTDNLSLPAPELSDDWAAELTAIENPTLIRYHDGSATQVRMAFNANNHILLARPGSGGFVPLNSADEPSLTAPPPWGEDAQRDPALHFRSGRLELYFTAIQDEIYSIARALWDPVQQRFDGAGAERLLFGDGTIQYSDPTVFSHGAALHMIARVRTAEGPSLRLFREMAGAWSEINTILEPSAAATAFDRDDIRAPEVYTDERIIRLYYEGRRGRTSSIGLLVSSDLAYWRQPVEGGRILGPDGVGFDALGVRMPAILDTGSEFRVYYAGHDGLRTRIGYFLHPHPNPIP